MKEELKLFRKAIGKNLQTRRKAAGFKSAKSFADYMGINANTYTDYEQGRISFSYEQAWEFADKLGCTLDAIGGRTPSAIAYEDQDQAILNSRYENMNAKGKEMLVSVARSMERDAANRVLKDREEHNDNSSAMGA